MRGTRLRAALAVLLAAAVAVSVRPATAADDQELRGLLLELGEEDNEKRRQTIRRLGETGELRAADLLKAFSAGGLHRVEGKVVRVETVSSDRDVPTDEAGYPLVPLSDPLTGEPLFDGGERVVVSKRNLDDFSAPRSDRRLIRDTVLLVEVDCLVAERQLAALTKCGDLREPSFLVALGRVADTATSEHVARIARESICLIRLGGRVEGQSAEEAIAAARQLGEMRSARGSAVLAEILSKPASRLPEGLPRSDRAQQAYRESFDQIEGYQRWVRGFKHLFSGLSLGSILVLMALGLSIIFGLMGVINMAHGELMMIGAYATYEIQELFVSSLPPGAFDWYFAVALPTSFFAAALVGILIERLVVRHLYGRPLETLLATWGVGLILIQIVRLFYGDNIGVNSPTWLRGGTEIFQDFTLPFNRCFVLAVCVFCVALVTFLMRYTKTGLLVRATMQNRNMAASLGVNTRRIDGYTFALGAGLAGVAGCALTLIGGVTPDMGQNYIVDSFLVVVTGGVGELVGAVCAGMGIGVTNKIIEPFTGAVWGKVLILLAVILFIQWRPAGLFPPKGRLADV